MKQALLLFAKTSVDAGKADPVALCALITNDQVIARWAYLEDLVFYIGGNRKLGLYDVRNQCEIQDYSVVYFRYWAARQGHAVAAAHLCKILGVPFVDREVVQTGTRNKLSQYVLLAEADIRLPRSLMGSPAVLRELYGRYGFTFPFIMKDKSGARGEDNYLVKDAAQLQAIAAANADKTFIIQEFIPNDGDYRVLVIGGKAKMLIRRTATDGSHLNNISQGGAADALPLTELPAEAIAMSEKAADIFGRDIAGVDLVRSKADGKYYCFEVNRAPQIEHSSFEQEKAVLLSEYLASF